MLGVVAGRNYTAGTWEGLPGRRVDDRRRRLGSLGVVCGRERRAARFLRYPERLWGGASEAPVEDAGCGFDERGA